MPGNCQSYLDLGGTIRSCPAAETLAFVEPLLDNFGITRIANVSGLDTLNIPVAICIRPNAKHLSVAQGKGISWELAKLSAIMESIEGYHAENPPVPEHRGCYVDLAKELPLISPHLFGHGFLQMPEFEKMSLDWIAALDLVSKKTVFLPHILLSLDSTYSRPEYSFFAVNSNGLASGNTLAEAILHGLCEVIERDAVCRWRSLSNEHRQKTQIRLESIESPVNRTLLENFTALGLRVKIWDIAQAIEIPAFLCAIQDSDVLRRLAIFYGSGAHISREIALTRALTEAAQSRLTLITGSRDDVFLDRYQQQFTMPHSTFDLSGERDFSLCPSPNMQPSFDANIDELLRLLLQNGYQQILVVDHTKLEFMLPVVHVFIPGMQTSGHRI